MKKIQVYFLIFVVSLTTLSFEIILVRVFSITGWQNYASMIITMALLGIGISGSILALLKEKLKKNPDKLIKIISFFYPLSFVISYLLYTIIPFNAFEVIWDSNQLIYLIIKFFILVFPFFTGSLLIGLGFLGKCSVGSIYFFNLIGSGLGGIAVLILSNFSKPNIILIIISLISLLIPLQFLFIKKAKTCLKFIIYKIIIPVLLIAVNVFVLLLAFNMQNIPEFKGISYTLRLPNAEILEEKYSPLGLVQVIKADTLRKVSGLSYRFIGEIPEQRGIYFDGEGMSSIIPFNGDFDRVDYLNYTIQNFPYVLHNKLKNVLIIGVGGGESLLRALSHNPEKIKGVELNNNVIEIMKNSQSEFSGNIYNNSKVEIINKDARSFINSTKEKFDIIEISLLESFSASSGGVYSLNESYLYTIEALREYYLHLSDNGILSITRWLKVPPRDILKLFATAIEMLKQECKDNPEALNFQNIILIRSSNTATLLIGKNPLDIEKAKQFCNSLRFDLIYYDGIKPDEVNKNFILKEPLYYNACMKIVSEEKNVFINNYPFDINITDDNRPYYFNFFNWKSLPYINKNNIHFIPFTEWGYIILLILLIPTIIVSFIGVILPLLFNRKRNLNASKNIRAKSKIKIFIYFFSIGIAFFFIEIPLIQKFIFFLSHPTYSISIIIASLLIFSGLGSYFYRRIFTPKYIRLAPFIIIIIIGLIYLFTLGNILNSFIQFDEIVKIIITVILIAPLGFFMGVPFPLGLSKIKDNYPSLIPWAWAINGFASVISILLASVISILFGLSIVLIISLIFYFISALTVRFDGG